MLADNNGKKLNEYVSDYVLFDLETTGISVNADEVIEISAVKVKDGKIVDEFSTLVNPQMPIPAAASAVNGIYDDMVANSPVFEEALKDFLDFAGDEVLVGHNIHGFDMKFICRDAKKYWGKVVGNNYVDTLQLSRLYLPDVSSHRLTALAEHYGISSDGAHRALADCRMNQKVFEHLATEMKNLPKQSAVICPKCGSPMQKRKGPYGEFYGCSSFPDCRNTINIR